MTEVVPGVHRRVAPLGDRFVCIFLVVGSASAAVIDTGVAGSPDTALTEVLDALEVARSLSAINACPNQDEDFMLGLYGKV